VAANPTTTTTTTTTTATATTTTTEEGTEEEEEEEAPWLIELFPGWPTTEPAAFESLRVKGGFEVSASYAPTPGQQQQQPGQRRGQQGRGVVSPITLTSHAGEPCAVLDPWWSGSSSSSSRTQPGRITVSTSDGAHVPARWISVRSGNALLFNTSVGVRYELAGGGDGDGDDG
jgi:hypothetical protein